MLSSVLQVQKATDDLADLKAAFPETTDMVKSVVILQNRIDLQVDASVRPTRSIVSCSNSIRTELNWKDWENSASSGTSQRSPPQPKSRRRSLRFKGLWEASRRRRTKKAPSSARRSSSALKPTRSSRNINAGKLPSSLWKPL